VDAAGGFSRQKRSKRIDVLPAAKFRENADRRDAAAVAVAVTPSQVSAASPGRNVTANVAVKASLLKETKPGGRCYDFQKYFRTKNGNKIGSFVSNWRLLGRKKLS
jgi:hypothetical protein